MKFDQFVEWRFDVGFVFLLLLFGESVGRFHFAFLTPEI